MKNSGAATDGLIDMASGEIANRSTNQSNHGWRATGQVYLTILASYGRRVMAFRSSKDAKPETSYQMYKDSQRADVFGSTQDLDRRVVYRLLVWSMTLLFVLFVVVLIYAGKDLISDSSGARPSGTVPGNTVHKLISFRTVVAAIDLPITGDVNSVPGEALLTMSPHAVKTQIGEV